jgi:hypothetical protein
MNITRQPKTDRLIVMFRFSSVFRPSYRPIKPIGKLISHSSSDTTHYKPKQKGFEGEQLSEGVASDHQDEKE